METESYPWRKPTGLEEALAAVQPVFAALGVVAPAGGCTESEVAAAERRVTRPLPADVRAFYRAMRPTGPFSAGAQREFGFYPIGSDELSWRAMDGAEPAEDWTGAAGLSLGQSVFGDPFWWVDGHRSLPSGSIVLLDHDGGLGGDVMFVHFARSFREFLAKVAYFKNLYAPGDELFQREYRELNRLAQRY